MKTTLDIPSEIWAEAMQLSGAKSKRAVALQALENFTRTLKMRRLALELGDSVTFMMPEELNTLRKKAIS
jgi:hypothetical protein